METVLIVIHLMVVIAMVVVVLLQRSEGGALGIGGGGAGGGGLFSSRGTANVLTRTTAILAVTFFATSILLTVLARNANNAATILDTIGSEQPASGSTPIGENLLDSLKKPEQPSGPQVPASE